MKDWNINEWDELIESINKRKNLGKSVSSDKIQAKLLCDLMEDFMFKQFILDPTQKNNILDLFFCNDFNLVEEYKIIEKIFDSDHCSIIIETNINNMLEDESDEYVNHYTTDIPNYEMLDASPEEWRKLNESILDIDWYNNIKNMTSDEAFDFIVNKVEEGVQLCMRKK